MSAKEVYAEQSHKMLIVDDNREYCENLMDIFGYFGNMTECAFDGQQAVNKVSHNNPDVVLMDVQMPVMDGVTALKEVKRLAPPVRVLLMSATLAPHIIEEARREGAEAVLSKPIDPLHVLRIMG